MTRPRGNNASFAARRACSDAIRLRARESRSAYSMLARRLARLQPCLCQLTAAHACPAPRAGETRRSAPRPLPGVCHHRLRWTRPKFIRRVHYIDLLCLFPRPRPVFYCSDWTCSLRPPDRCVTGLKDRLCTTHTPHPTSILGHVNCSNPDNLAQMAGRSDTRSSGIPPARTPLRRLRHNVLNT